jgi:hypothetical protein
MRITIGCALLIFLFARGVSAQTVVQDDFPSQVCPGETQLTDIIPDVQIVLSTSGQPVVVSYVVNFRASPQAGIYTAAYVDGVRDTAHQLDRAIGDYLDSGQADTITLMRVYNLPKGTHVFELGVSCVKAVNIYGWMTAYEVMKVGKP